MKCLQALFIAVTALVAAMILSTNVFGQQSGAASPHGLNFEDAVIKDSV
jgi:hypothetical protein